MNADALFKAFPESSWLPYVVSTVVFLTIIQLLFTIYTNMADRRSDARLLDQAEKATSILEKLPEGHRSRTEVLTYISHGPLAELSQRHTNRIAKKKDAKKRRRENLYLAVAFTLPLILILPSIGYYYNDFLSNPPIDNTDVPTISLIFFATALLLMIYAIYALGFSIIAICLMKAIDLARAIWDRIEKWIITMWQAWKGKGGVYQI